MINIVTLVGRLTADPEIRAAQNGDRFATFTVAVERDYKTPAGEKITDFIPCIANKQRAEFIGNYFTKGSMIGIVGALQQSKKEINGENRTFYTVSVDKVSFTGGKAENATNSATSPENNALPPATVNNNADEGPYDDELPF